MKTNAVFFTALCMLCMNSIFAQITFTNQSNLLNNPNLTSGAALGVVDMNDDGLDDLVRLDNASDLEIEYQQANGTFSRYDYGNVGSGSEWGLCVADADGNGFRDVFTGGAYNGLKLLKANATGSAFTATNLSPPSIFMQCANFVDIDNNGTIDVFACHDDGLSAPFSNDGNGNFTYNTGLINAISTNPSDNSGNYGSVWTDYDNDGDLDMYLSKCRLGVTNPLDGRRVNMLFQNDGNNNFTDVAEAAGLRPLGQSWAADFADIDNDGDLDCFVINHDIPSFLYSNNGDGTFTDITAASGITQGVDDVGIGIQVIFEDFNNDGFMDMLYTGRSGEHRLFMNNGNLTFNTLSTAFPTGGLGIQSAAVGDLNNDGFLDVLAAYATGFNSPSNNEDNIFFNNGNANNYFKINLKGTTSNSDGIGARLELYGAWGQQIREVRSGESYGIMNSLTQHFGIGGATTIDQLVIKWPSGTVDIICNPNINQVLTVIEGSSPSNVGATCDDGDANTINDVIQADGCTCAGLPDGLCDNNGGDADNDGVCADEDCDDNDPAFPMPENTPCDDGDANTTNDVIQADGCTCMGTTTNTPDCNTIVIAGGNENITISNLTAPIIIIKVFDSSWQTVFDCTNSCDRPQIVAGLSAGTYYVSVKYFESNWATICEHTGFYEVTSGGNPCDNNGGDADNDGVCADEDCDDNDPAFPMPENTPCDDGDANTINDVIQADGCTCAGVPDNLCDNNGGDADNDGVCADEDCDDNDPAFPMPENTPCDDGDANTNNDVIQADGCTCAGVPDNLCDNNGGDADNDGVCADEDCDDNDPNFPMSENTPCDDGDANTINDAIQADGCTCQGVPDTGEPDCDNVVFEGGEGSVTISNIVAPISIVKVFNSSWQTAAECSGNCNTTEVFSNLPEGTYYVNVKFFTANWGTICETSQFVTVSDGNGCTNVTNGGQIGTNEILCGNSGDPGILTNIQSPTGGTGSLQYLWLESTISNQVPADTNDPNWTIIAGATSATYDPTTISETTHYVRFAKRTGCTDYEEVSNVITKTIDPNCGGSNIILTCPNNITVTQDEPTGRIVTWDEPTATTDCNQGNATITQTEGLANGSLFPIGVSIISYQATDPCGGQAACTFTVTVNADNTSEPPAGYCAAKGNQPWQQWISTVNFGAINNESFKEQYGDFTNLSTNVTKGQSYPITLTPGFSWATYNEYWRVWIDYNRDGDFEDAGEKVFEGNSSTVLTGSISIPSTAATGATRMRIAMKNGAYATPCETFDLGEVEDYLVYLQPNNGNFAIENVSRLDWTLYPNPAHETVYFNVFNKNEEEMDLVIMDATGRAIKNVPLTNTTQSISVQDLPNGLYWVALKTSKGQELKRLVITK